MNPLQKFNITPPLDTLRFFAFLAVFISHTILFLPPLCSGACLVFLQTHFTIGDLGVSTFFVLSGFLITILLLTEKYRSGRVSIRSFYARRILRIWPLYLLIIFLGAFVIPALVHQQVFPIPYTLSRIGDVWRLLTFTFNFDHQNNFLHVSLVLGVLWSISVEEQFYLLWPVIIKFVRQKILPYILVGIMIFATVFRYLHAFDLSRSTVEYSTLSVMSDIAIGALCAYIYSYRADMVSRIKKLHCTMLTFASLTVIVGDIGTRNALLANRLFVAIEPIFFSLAIAMLLVVLLNNTPPKWTRNPVLVYLGKISYGLYMYHIIAMMLTLLLVRLISLPPIVVILGSFGMTTVLASLSYTYFEKLFLYLKKHFGNPDSVTM